MSSGDQTIADSEFGNGTYVQSSSNLFYYIVINKHAACPAASVAYNANRGIISAYNEAWTKVDPTKLPADVKNDLDRYYFKFINDMSAYDVGEHVSYSGRSGTIKSKIVNGYLVQFDDEEGIDVFLCKVSELKSIE
jgi:hypothetical protein